MDGVLRTLRNSGARGKEGQTRVARGGASSAPLFVGRQHETAPSCVILDKARVIGIDHILKQVSINQLEDGA